MLLHFSDENKSPEWSLRNHGYYSKNGRIQEQGIFQLEVIINKNFLMQGRSAQSIQPIGDYFQCENPWSYILLSLFFNTSILSLGTVFVLCGLKRAVSTVTQRCTVISLKFINGFNDFISVELTEYILKMFYLYFEVKPTYFMIKMINLL